MNFLRSYVKTLHPDIDSSEEEQLARQVMKEANFYALASNFFWTLWSIHMAISTSIQFGYMVSRWAMVKWWNEHVDRTDSRNMVELVWQLTIWFVIRLQVSMVTYHLAWQKNYFDLHRIHFIVHTIRWFLRQLNNFVHGLLMMIVLFLCCFLLLHH